MGFGTVALSVSNGSKISKKPKGPEIVVSDLAENVCDLLTFFVGRHERSKICHFLK